MTPIQKEYFLTNKSELLDVADPFQLSQNASVVKVETGGNFMTSTYRGSTGRASQNLTSLIW